FRSSQAMRALAPLTRTRPKAPLTDEGKIDNRCERADKGQADRERSQVWLVIRHHPTLAAARYAWGASWRRGGVATQRPAKPSTPVRLRSSPLCKQAGNQRVLGPRRP